MDYVSVFCAVSMYLQVRLATFSILEFDSFPVLDGAVCRVPFLFYVAVIQFPPIAYSVLMAVFLLLLLKSAGWQVCFRVNL